jgi:hypothetical protein
VASAAAELLQALRNHARLEVDISVFLAKIILVLSTAGLDLELDSFRAGGVSAPIGSLKTRWPGVVLLSTSG